MEKEMYSKENQENILKEILNPENYRGKPFMYDILNRPDLSYLTHEKFTIIEQEETLLETKDRIYDSKENLVFVEIPSNRKYVNPVSKLPQLVQCAEILFDLTSNAPESINHKIVSDLLNSLKP